MIILFQQQEFIDNRMHLNCYVCRTHIPLANTNTLKNVWYYIRGLKMKSNDMSSSMVAKE